jgi:hypothetical protein
VGVAAHFMILVTRDCCRKDVHIHLENGSIAPNALVLVQQSGSKYMMAQVVSKPENDMFVLVLCFLLIYASKLHCCADAKDPHPIGRRPAPQDRMQSIDIDACELRGVLIVALLEVTISSVQLACDKGGCLN